MKPLSVRFVSGMVQLPNGDLWRPAQPGAEREDNVTAVSAAVSTDDTIAQIITAQSADAQYTCVWCGTAFDKKQLNELREHIETRHSSRVDDEGREAALAAALTEVQAKPKAKK
jgi:hypothetical protein